MNRRPINYSDVESCVEETLRRVGRRVVLGTPLGLGKANHLVNEFYRRACADPQLNLHIFTALTLSQPRYTSEFERRLVCNRSSNDSSPTIPSWSIWSPSSAANCRRTSR